MWMIPYCFSSNNFGSPARIRTWTLWTKTRCATVTQRDYKWWNWRDLNRSSEVTQTYTCFLFTGNGRFPIQETIQDIKRSIVVIVFWHFTSDTLISLTCPWILWISPQDEHCWLVYSGLVVVNRTRFSSHLLNKRPNNSRLFQLPNVFRLLLLYTLTYTLSSRICYY